MAGAKTDTNSLKRFVPIRGEVIAECEEQIVKSISRLFRPFEEGVHEAYAKTFVAELTRRMNMIPVPQRRREECLVGVVLYFLEDTEVYRASTNLMTEFQFMFDVTKVHLEELEKSDTESSDRSQSDEE